MAGNVSLVDTLNHQRKIARRCMQLALSRPYLTVLVSPPSGDGIDDDGSTNGAFYDSSRVAIATTLPAVWVVAPVRMVAWVKLPRNLYLNLRTGIASTVIRIIRRRARLITAIIRRHAVITTHIAVWVILIGIAAVATLV